MTGLFSTERSRVGRHLTEEVGAHRRATHLNLSGSQTDADVSRETRSRPGPAQSSRAVAQIVLSCSCVGFLRRMLHLLERERLSRMPTLTK